MAAAHVLQDNGKMLEVDTSRLFSNIPDVLNASLAFWEITMYPMLADAVNNAHPWGQFCLLLRSYYREANEEKWPARPRPSYFTISSVTKKAIIAKWRFR